jgi:Universal stress protein family
MTSEPRIRRQLNRILVAIDSSEGAATALRAAIGLAAQVRADVVVLNVFERDEGSVIHAPEIGKFARDEHFQGGDEGKRVASQTVLGGAKTIVDDVPVSAHPSCFWRVMPPRRFSAMRREYKPILSCWEGPAENASCVWSSVVYRRRS